MEKNIKEVITELIPDECYFVDYNADKSTKLLAKIAAKSSSLRKTLSSTFMLSISL